MILSTPLPCLAVCIKIAGHWGLYGIKQLRVMEMFVIRCFTQEFPVLIYLTIEVYYAEKYQLKEQHKRRIPQAIPAYCNTFFLEELTF